MIEDPSRKSGLVHEHEFEPVPGLPEELPPGEKLLWQGSPDWRALAVRAFHVRKLVVYFAILVVVRVAVLLGAGATAGEMVLAALFMAMLGVVAVGVMAGLAWLTARATVYTVTDRRVVLRVGIVLTLAFNIPFKRIEAAGLHVEKDGSGDIPLTLAGDDRIAWLNLWLHARPWRLARPEPMLRSVPRAAHVARLLAEAWSAQSGLPAMTQALDASAGAAPAGAGTRSERGSQSGMPALAGR
jgi:hypothetical protein